ncbi:MAG: hypothetical protein PHY79_24470, partial [Anaerolineae bacterium]|nr:hypothetical protein [Anaerolineae bacterium]
MSETGSVEFQPYRTPVLFVLVGENPLPNYVAARLLLEPGGRLYLVHSKGPGGTGEIANRLKKQITGCTPCPIPVNEHDAADLRAAVVECLKDTTAELIGLNYTGGTKFMAVHTYQAIEEFCEDKGITPVLSYLHADTLELTVESRPGCKGFRRCVAQEVRPTFKEIFDLHGIGFSGTQQVEPRHMALAEALAGMNSSREGFEAWKRCRELLFAAGDRLWNEVRSEMQRSGATHPFLRVLESTLGLEAERPLNLWLAAKREGFGTPQKLSNWLLSDWLEEWTLACVKACAEETGCREWYRDIVGEIPGNTARAATRQFQIDVAALRGYQLFALSCKAVSVLREAKLGLMEIFARSRQMGGEEARAALVTTQLDAAMLEQDFASDWGADKRV